MTPLDCFSGVLARLSAAPLWALLLAKVTLLLAAVWAIHFGLARANPRWRTLLWRGSAIGLALAAVGTLGLPGLEIRVPATASDLAPESLATPPAVLALDSVDRMESSGRGEMPAPARPADDAVPVAPAQTAESPESPLSWSVVLLGIWSFGVALAVVRLAIGYVRLARLEQTSQAVSEEIVAELSRIAVALGCRRTVRARSSRHYAVPFLYGLWRPTLTLPERMCQPEYRGQLPGIFAHELTHVRSCDFAWNAALQAVSLLLWFHPLAWRMGVAHRTACDAVCDAVSASYLGDVQAYCRTLARVALEGAEAFPAAGLAMARTCDVRRRIAVLQHRVFSTSLGRRSLAVASSVGLLSLALLAVTRLALAADTPALQATAQWARQHGWKAAEIEKTTLESKWGVMGVWRNLPFEIGADEERNVRECVALAQSYGSSTNGVNHFDRQETRQALEAVLARQPNFFYAEYLLGVWSQSHGDAPKAQDFFDRAYRHAPTVIVQCFETPDGKPVADVSVQTFALECNRVKNGSLDPSLKLLYPRLHTDKNGCICLPVYQTVYRRDDMASPNGYEPQWPRLGWFQTSAKVGLLPVCVLKKMGLNEEPPPGLDADAGRKAYQDRLQRADMTAPGHVADVQGRPVANATVKRANSPWTATTDAHGKFALPELKLGESASLAVSAEGFLPMHSEAAVTNSGSDYVCSGGWPIELVRPSRISGRVLDPNGKPLASAPLSIDTWVQLRQCSSSTGNYAESVTDAEGRFVMERIPPGSHVLYYPGQQCHSPRSIPAKGVYGALVVEPTDGQELKDLVLDLSKSTASVEGQVFGPDGKPMAGVLVGGSLWHQWGNMSGGAGPHPSAPKTGADGRYKITGIGPGQWELRPSHPNFQRVQPTQKVTLVPGQKMHQDLRVAERTDIDYNSSLKAAAEAERTDDLNKLHMSFHCTGIPPVDQHLAMSGSLAVMDLSNCGASHLPINVKSLGLPDTATPEEIARAAHAGEFYFLPPDRLVTLNGTIIAPFAPPPDRNVGPYFGKMTRADIVKQIEASRRQNPDADGRRIVIQKDEHYIVVRSDGQGYEMKVTGVGKSGPSLKFQYLGHFRIRKS